MYLLGWGNTRGENTYLVQYVDTLTGCDSTYGSRVPSNGGIICVVLATEKVLQMCEDFHLCEQAEKKNLKLTKISGDYQNCIVYGISFQQLSTC